MIKGIEISNFNVLVPTSVWLQKEQTYFPIPKAMTLILPLGGFTNTIVILPTQLLPTLWARDKTNLGV
jgi:hypothetical protein